MMNSMESVVKSEEIQPISCEIPRTVVPVLNFRVFCAVFCSIVLEDIHGHNRPLCKHVWDVDVSKKLSPVGV